MAAFKSTKYAAAGKTCHKPFCAADDFSVVLPDFAIFSMSNIATSSMTYTSYHKTAHALANHLFRRPSCQPLYRPTTAISTAYQTTPTATINKTCWSTNESVGNLLRSLQHNIPAILLKSRLVPVYSTEADYN